MTGSRHALRVASLVGALTLVLAACTPAAVPAFFAACPESAQDVWSAEGRWGESPVDGDPEVRSASAQPR